MGPSSSDAPIQLERYAELSAEAQLAPPLAALLERESIDEATWGAAQAYWLAHMADEARRQRFATTSRYQASFERRRRALESERKAKAPAKEALGADAGPSHTSKPVPMPSVPSKPGEGATSGAAVPPPPMLRPAVVGPSPAAYPALAGEPSASPAPPPAPPPPPLAWPAPVAAVREAVVAPPMPVAAPATPEPARPRKAPATMIGVLLVDPGKALPFREGAAVAPALPESAPPKAAAEVADAAHAPAPKRRVDLGSTVFADPDAESAPATPFDAAPSTEPTPRRKRDLGATMMADDVRDVPAMPFANALPDQRARAFEPRVSARPMRADERTQAPVAGASALGTTLPPTTQPLPGAGDRGRGGGRRFTIDVFASLTAEIAENPSDVEAIRRRYGIGEAEHREESERWTTAFDADDELRKRYLGIVQRCRGYVRGQKNG